MHANARTRYRYTHHTQRGQSTLILYRNYEPILREKGRKANKRGARNLKMYEEEEGRKKEKGEEDEMYEQKRKKKG